MSNDLSKRLNDAYRMLPKDQIIMDIGADRGLLAKELARNNVKVYASENKKGPYQALLDNTVLEREQYGLECIFTDGIDILPSCVTTLSLMGMGGGTIYDILSRHEEKLSQIQYLLIEPQSDFTLPLKYLLDRNYHVIDGHYVFEKRYYPMLLLKKEDNTMDYNEVELPFGIIPLRSKDPVLKECLLAQRKHILSFPEDVRKAKNDELAMIEKGLMYYE